MCPQASLNAPAFAAQLGLLQPRLQGPIALAVHLYITLTHEQVGVSAPSSLSQIRSDLDKQKTVK
jgi:hypothetical protein